MRISYNWLRDFVDIPDTPLVLADKLTDAGVKVESVEPSGDDAIIDLEITTNRPDCLSHLGVAREVAVIYKGAVRRPDFKVTECDTRTAEVFTISIADPDLCGRYSARYVEGVRIGPSPKWLSARLEALGVRSINNVADVTNLVMLELGQPLHAFDADTLTHQEIIVRRAGLDEPLQTLDGVKRTLNPNMLVIADAERPVGLAGIMGGGETEISARTANVLLESAWFAPLSIRRTARALNMTTEASYRFERGGDIELCPFACDRAAALIQELAGGRILKGLIDVYPERKPAPEVRLRRRYVRDFLGAAVPDAFIEDLFRRLEFEVSSSEKDWCVRAPSYRVDITREEDLLEEIARHYGFDQFPYTVPKWSGRGKALPWERHDRQLRSLLAGLGYTETTSLSLSNEADESRFASGWRPVVLQNPLSEEGSSLRTSMVPSALRSLSWNLNRGIRAVQIYEIGKAYHTGGEEMRLVLAATGDIREKAIFEVERSYGFFDLKGDVELVLRAFGASLQAAGTGVPDYYHPGRSARLAEWCVLGELHPDVVESWKLRQKVFVAELRLMPLYQSSRSREILSTPRYPAVRRDLSLLVKHGTAFAALSQAIRSAEIGELIEIEPFDRLEKGPFPETHYSISITLLYQSPDRTLTDDEVEAFDRRILELLETRTGARLRS